MIVVSIFVGIGLDPKPVSACIEHDPLQMKVWMGAQAPSWKGLAGESDGSIALATGQIGLATAIFLGSVALLVAIQRRRVRLRRCLISEVPIVIGFDPLDDPGMLIIMEPPDHRQVVIHGKDEQPCVPGRHDGFFQPFSRSCTDSEAPIGPGPEGPGQPDFGLAVDGLRDSASPLATS
jgi:hypothetical protein